MPKLALADANGVRRVREQCNAVARLCTFISKLSTLWRLMTASFSAC